MWKRYLPLLLILLIGVTTSQAANQVKIYLPLIQNSGTALAGCPVFPNDNAWNQDISKLPVDSNSGNYIAAIDAGGRAFLHPDFGSDPSYGIPYIVVPATQPLVQVNVVGYPDESDFGPAPIPANAPIEAGSDAHVLVLRQGECHLYELYHSVFTNPGWEADATATWDLHSNALRPEGWTSADAAGLPILPGLARYDEIKSGRITHALRFTVWRSQRGYIHPATHQAGGTNDPNYPPMGLRLRLKANYDLSGFSGDSLVILQALKTYGMIVADNGSSWYISGATDPRWDDTDLEQLKGVPSSAFEVVETGIIQH